MTRVLIFNRDGVGELPGLQETGIEIRGVCSVPELLQLVRIGRGEMVVLEHAGKPGETDDLILELQRIDPNLPIVIRTISATTDDVIRFVRLGAFHVIDHLESTISLTNLILRARDQALHANRVPPQRQEPWRKSLVGESPAMSHVADIIRLVASRRSTVLITGETGTGKEVVARAIHVAGGREHLPFVAVNCSAIPENLIESELFGYVKGAFTGATQSRPGKFELANGGTIFLDEIGDLPTDMQTRLLRVLQEREIQRLGSSETVRLNVRVIAATNKDLAASVEQKLFREDLYYRLNVVPLHLPALRERRSDIPALTEFFLTRICEHEDLPKKRLTASALQQLLAYDWPGNVRQLEHAIEMAVVLSGERQTLDTADFPSLRKAGLRSETNLHVIHVPQSGLNYDETLSRVERSILEQALAIAQGNKARAAELLQMKRTTLLARMKTLQCSDYSTATACA